MSVQYSTSKTQKNADTCTICKRFNNNEKEIWSHKILAKLSAGSSGRFT